MLSLLLAVFAAFSVSSASHAQQAQPGRPISHDVAIVAIDIGDAVVVSNRAPGRLLAEPSRLRTFGPGEAVPFCSGLSEARPTSFAWLAHHAGDPGSVPDAKLARIADDRAPPSH